HVHSFLVLRLRPPPRSTLFPYTTLFRFHILPGLPPATTRPHDHPRVRWPAKIRSGDQEKCRSSTTDATAKCSIRPRRADTPFRRSEEHTSELQSRENLVCRLLLEKKKKK